MMQSQEGMESVVTSADGSSAGAVTLSDKKNAESGTQGRKAE
ncbi:hypothetical protein [Bifidobacterium moukalabense]|nr:hypothetical protein [Bifidobacterium moukalabense]